MDMMADPVINYDIALPLTETRLTIDNLIDLKDGGLFVPDDSSLLHIVYAMESTTVDIVKKISLESTAAFGFSSGQVPYTCIKDTVISIPFSQQIFIDMSEVDAKLKAVYLSSADMRMATRNSFLFPMDLRMEFNNITDQNGQKLVYSTQILEESSCDTTVQFQDIKINLGVETKPYIDVSGTATVYVKRIEGDTTLRLASLYSSNTFQNMQFKRAEGTLFRTEYTLRGQMSIAGLGLERMRNIKFDEATLMADMKLVGISAPLRMAHSDVRIHNAGEPAILPLYPENYDVAYPDINAEPLEKESQVGMAIVDVLIDRPNSISYDLDAVLNPDNDSSTLQALQQNSQFSVGLTCDIPLHFAADRYSLCDTLELNLNDLPEDTEIRYFDIKSIVKNAFPLDASFSIHFLDARHHELFTLFHEDSIQGGVVGPEPGLHVVEPVVSRFEDVLEVSELENVRSMSYIVVDATFSTTDGKTAKFYVDGEKEGYMDVKVGVRIKIKQSGLLGGGTEDEK